MSKKTTTAEFILKSRKLYGDDLDYSQTNYIDGHHPVTLRCKKHSSEWSQSPSKHLHRSNGCPKCTLESTRLKNAKKFQLKLDELYDSSIKFKLSEYQGQKLSLDFYCSNHKGYFTKLPGSMINGLGCGECINEDVVNLRSKKTIKSINKYVSELNGKLLSTEYINNLNNLDFRCNEGHEFQESWSDVQFKMRWCPKCSKNKNIGEELTRQMLEHALQMPMPTRHIKELKGLELDGYNDEKRIAFEYQGFQHSQKTAFFHSSDSEFESQLERDKLKREICLENNICLLEVEQFHHISRKSIPKFYDQVLELLRANEIIYIEDTFVVDLKELFSNKLSEQYVLAKKIVNESGGTIEGYIGSETKHKYYCSKGHINNRVLSSIISSKGSCKNCKEDERFLELQMLVIARGGVLIDNEWKGINATYKWRCSRNHVNLSIGAVLKNHACQKCKVENSRVTVDDKTLSLLYEEATNGLNYQKDIVKKFNVSDHVYRRLLNEGGIIPQYLPHDRTLQKKKTKGKLLQLDPVSFKIIKVFESLESVKNDESGIFRPEGVRYQMKKYKKAYGYYWCREKDYNSTLKALNHNQ